MFFGETVCKSLSMMRPFSTSVGIATKYIPSTASRLTMSNDPNIIPLPPKNFNKAFKLPPKIQSTYEIINSHPNDQLLKFEPNRHVYSYNGKELKTSVTSFIESYFEKFNPDEVIPRMMNGQNWPRPEYTVCASSLIKTFFTINTTYKYSCC